MDNLLTVREASEYLKCSVWTIRRLCKREEITFNKKRHGILFRMEDLEIYARQGRIIARLNFNFNFKKNLTNDLKSNNFISEVNDLTRNLKKSKTRHYYGYGSVYQREKGKSWTMDFYDESGKRVQKAIPSATCKQEAEQALQQERFKDFDNASGIEKPRDENIGFRDFAKIYLEDYMMTVRRNFSSDTHRLQILCDYFKNTDLRIVSRLDVERFRKERLKKGNKKITTNRYLQLLKKMFNLAIEENYCEENPVKKVKLFSEKENQINRILTEPEEAKLLQNCSSHLKPIIIHALNTGMRKSEILNLQKSQVDLKNRTIRVEKTKSGKVRYIPINNDLFKQILKLKNENGKNPFVFFNPKTERPYLDMKTGFKRACRISGIKGLRFHDLRHTFASRLIEGGIDIETVKDLCGHYSITITERYIHTNDERKRKAVEILSKKSDRTGLNSDKMVTIENQSGLIS